MDEDNELTDREIRQLKEILQDVEKVRRLLGSEETLSKIAQSDQAWSYVSATLKRYALWITSMIAAGVLLYDKLKAFVQTASK